MLPKTARALADWDGDARAAAPRCADALLADLRRQPARGGRRGRQAAQLRPVRPALAGAEDGARSCRRRRRRHAASNSLQGDRRALGRAALPGARSERALPAHTDFYLLAAVDLRRDARRRDRRAPAPTTRSSSTCCCAPSGSAPSVTLLCLLLGYPLAYWSRPLPARIAPTAADPGAAAVLDLAAGAHDGLDRAAAERRRGQQRCSAGSA